jgi:hypothetical protein
MSRKSSRYIVRDRDTGGKYIVMRKSPVNNNRYRWAKSSRESAVVLSYDAARKVIYNYGGVMVVA